MKATLLFILLLIQTTVFGHDYFFAFAEVEYNPFTQKFESTLTLSAHDLEYAWRDSNISIDSLIDYPQDSEQFQTISAFITKGFNLTSNGAQARFAIFGIDVLSNGMVYFYLLSDPITIGNTIDVRFDILMDEFPSQQNKLSYISNGKSTVATFLPNQRTQRVILEN